MLLAVNVIGDVFEPTWEFYMLMADMQCCGYRSHGMVYIGY